MLRTEMQSLARARGISDQVRFLGVVSDVRTVLAASDISVIPSTSETFSMAMLEALAMGVPIVATDVGGAAEAVTHQVTGLLVTAGDSDALASAFELMIQNDDARLAMSEFGRHVVASKFSQETMVTRTEQLLCRTAFEGLKINLV